MNVKITRPDGTVIEAEGTVEECQAFALAMSPASPTLTIKSAPVQLPLPIEQPALPWGPWGPQPWDISPYISPYQPPQQPIMPWQTVPYTPDITWWMPSTSTTDRLMLDSGSRFAVGDQPVVSGSIFMSSGFQCTPTGSNRC